MTSYNYDKAARNPIHADHPIFQCEFKCTDFPLAKITNFFHEAAEGLLETAEDQDGRNKSSDERISAALDLLLQARAIFYESVKHH
jgi:hypothetical protein